MTGRRLELFFELSGAREQARSRRAFIAWTCYCDVVHIAIRRLVRKLGEDKISFHIWGTVVSSIFFIMDAGNVVSSYLLLG